MVSSYFFYQKKKNELSNFEEVFLKTASGTIQWIMTGNSRKMDSFKWDMIKMTKFKVLIGISDVYKTVSYCSMKIILRFQLMRIKFSRYTV